MTTPSLRSRLRYRFDRVMSAGATAQLLALALLTAVVILLVFAVITLSDLNPRGEPSLTVLYHELLETLDAGTIASFDGGHWWFAFLSVAMTLYGIFVVGALIGILANAIDQRLEDLRKGRSRVIEDDHLVVLEWSSEVFTILREVCAANANRRGASVVVMAPRDKVEMEDAIRTRIPDTAGTRIVCRTGDPLDLDDLEILALKSCRAIIILTPDDEDEPDSVVLKTLLALTHASKHHDRTHQVVVELRDPENLQVAELAGDHDVEFVLTTRFAASVIALACRQPGVSEVLSELLDFDGDEIYTPEVAEVTGLRFDEALLLFETSSLIGVAGPTGVELNPPKDRVFAPGEHVVAISADDDSVIADGQRRDATPDPSWVVVHAPAPPERTLVLGFNPGLTDIAHQLDDFVASGSELVVACADVELAKEVLQIVALEHLEVRFEAVDPLIRHELDTLDIGWFDHVVILSDATVEAERADAKTLSTLLHVRDIESRCDVNVNVVSEIRVQRNKVLAESSTDDDFIVSSQLLSLYIAQIVMNPKLAEVFAHVFDGGRCNIALRPMTYFVEAGSTTTYGELVAAAALNDETAIGYRELIEGGPGLGPIKRSMSLNPPKATTLVARNADQLIVLSPRGA